MIKHRYLAMTLILFFIVGAIGFIGYAVSSSIKSPGISSLDDYSYPSENIAEFINDSDNEPRPNNVKDPEKTSPGTKLSDDYLSSKLGISGIDEQIYRFTDTVPNDPYYPQWYLSTISAPATWDISTGSSAVTVAVIDSGFALEHEDLVDAWTINSGESGQTTSSDRCWDGSAKDKRSNNCDDDNNSYVDDYRGWDFSNNDNNPQAGEDSLGASHGTKVAGLVGARGNNGKGVVALNWQTKIMPLQGLYDEGYGYTSDIVGAIIYAVDNGADVINLSLGSPFADSAMQSAINYAYQNNVIVVAAAGNCGDDPTATGCEGSPNPGGMLYPGRYDKVISAGASTSSDTRASFSSFGPELDFMAPGHGTIQTTTWTAGNQISAYATSSYGTSFASPIIASLVALIKSEIPNANYETVYTLLDNNIDKLPAMGGADFTNEYGHGRINAFKTMANALALSSNPADPNNKPAVVSSSGQTPETSVGSSPVSTWCTTSPGSECIVTLTRQSDGVVATLPARKPSPQGVTKWSWNKSLIGSGVWEVQATANGKTSDIEILYVD